MDRPWRARRAAGAGRSRGRRRQGINAPASKSRRPKRHRTAGQAKLISVIWAFFTPDNWELQVKVLDRCAGNGHFWVLASASTNVEYLTDWTWALQGLAAPSTDPIEGV